MDREHAFARHSDRPGAPRPSRLPVPARRLARLAPALAVLALLLPWATSGQQVSYSYDEAGRLIRADYGNGASIRYVYDANGNLIETATTPAVPPEPELAVLLDGVPLADAQTEAVAFGSAVLGGTGAPRVFTVRNEGGAELTGLAVTVPTGFALAEGLAPTLAPAATDTFTVRIVPFDPGERSGEVSIASNDADENPFTFPVTGSVPPAAPRRFDFGTATSPVADGFTGVHPGTAYAVAAGFGWAAGTIDARDRATWGDLNRDFNFTPLGTFVVDLPNGTYDVALTVGDAAGSHDEIGVFLEGTLVDTVSPGRNALVSRSYRVAVADEQLTLTLDDLGGSDGYTVINSLVAQLRRGPSPRLPRATGGGH